MFFFSANLYQWNLAICEILHFVLGGFLNGACQVVVKVIIENKSQILPGLSSTPLKYAKEPNEDKSTLLLKGLISDTIESAFFSSVLRVCAVSPHSPLGKGAHSLELHG